MDGLKNEKANKPVLSADVVAASMAGKFLTTPIVDP